MNSSAKILFLINNKCTNSKSDKLSSPEPEKLIIGFWTLACHILSTSQNRLQTIESVAYSVIICADRD